MARKRIPITKIYRAFPELDKFSDDHCRAYVSIVRKSYSGSWMMMTIGRLAMAWAGFLLLSVGGSLGVVALLGVRPGQSWASVILLSLVIAGAVAAPWLVSISIRDHWLRRKIVQHLRAAVCVRCGYSLLGLTVAAGAVTCPECGEVLSLEKMGLKPEDILANTRDSQAVALLAKAPPASATVVQPSP